mgnify:CR=1 FL=1
MNELYLTVQATKQGLHQFLSRQIKREVIGAEVVELGHAIRKRHPGMGCRTMYDLMGSIKVGRDRSERILLSHGFRLKRRRSAIRTTFSLAHLRYPDLIRGLTVSGIDQVWQTDITYFLSTTNMVYYIVFIQDVYSRRILSWSTSDNLKAERNIECLLNAFKLRGDKDLRGLIHHSDPGSQYGDRVYLQILKDTGIRVSMSKQAWKNAYVERVNGTIKNSYLYAWNITCLEELKKAVAKAVHAYNNEKPHKNLPNKMSPVAFENFLLTTEPKNHPKFEIYNYEEK